MVYTPSEWISFVLQSGIESKNLVLNLAKSFYFPGAVSCDVRNDVGWVAKEGNAFEENREQNQASYSAKKWRRKRKNWMMSRGY
jgi:hypothetical protein